MIRSADEMQCGDCALAALSSLLRSQSICGRSVCSHSVCSRRRIQH